MLYCRVFRGARHREEDRLGERAAVARRRHGCFVAPAIVELPELGALRREVFGPILHVVRYARDELPGIVETLERIGYGLTLGVQTRLDETVDLVASRARVGNQYVNRNMIGAVVGVQPFGGEGLSGTGPKAGGPLYLRRLMQLPTGAPLPLPAMQDDASHSAAAWPTCPHRAAVLEALRALESWLRGRADPSAYDLAELCTRLARDTPLERTHRLDGPTGERNTWWLASRRSVLGVANDEADILFQFAHAVAAGSSMGWWDDGSGTVAALHASLPPTLRALARPLAELDAADFDVAIVQVGRDDLRCWSRRLAQLDGPIIAVIACVPGDRRYGSIALERLFVERSLSVNTAAAGGNASLMTIG